MPELEGELGREQVFLMVDGMTELMAGLPGDSIVSNDGRVEFSIRVLSAEEPQPVLDDEAAELAAGVAAARQYR